MRWLRAWSTGWLVVVCVGLVLVGWLLWPQREQVIGQGLVGWLLPRLVVVAVAAGVVSAVVTGWRAHRERISGRRGLVADRVVSVVAGELEDQGGHTTAVRWGRGVRAVRVVVRVGGDGALPGPQAVGRMARRVGEALGQGRWEGRAQRLRRRVVLVPSKGAATVEDERVQARDRAVKVLKQAVPGATSVAVKDWTEDHQPARIMVAYDPTPRVHSVTVEAAVHRVVAQAFPGRWRDEWDREHDRVVFRLVPGLPSPAYRPADLAAPPEGAAALRFGVNEDGQAHGWELTGSRPHCLVVGPTGGGKTVALRALALDALSQGMEVHGVDPKRIELMGLIGVPGVGRVATSPQDMAELIGDMYTLMNRRYEQIERREVTPAQLSRVLFIVDEFFILVMRLNRLWREDGNKGEHPAIGMVWEMAALARSARIHLAVGIQRPDAKFLDGPARDNFAFRLSLTALSEDGARMMWGRGDIGTDLPAIPGRAMSSGPQGPVEVQVYLLPDPDPHTRHELSERERAELDRILPALPEQPLPAETRRRGRPALEPAPGRSPVSEGVGKGEDLPAGQEASGDPDPVTGTDPAVLEEQGGRTTVPVPAEQLLPSELVELDDRVVQLTDARVDEADEEYVALEWAEGCLSVPAGEPVARVTKTAADAA